MSALYNALIDLFTNKNDPPAISDAATNWEAAFNAQTVDAAAATGSLRTIGTGALQACAGNDSRLSDARTPTAHAPTHSRLGGDAVTVENLTTAGAINTVPKSNGSGVLTMGTVGDVTGPSSSTDNRVARFDLATGKVIQESALTLADNGDLTPTTTDASDLGSASLAWAEIRARLLIAARVSGTGSISVPATTQGGIVAGKAAGSAGNTSQIIFGVGAAFPPIAALAATQSYGTAIARATHLGGGSLMVGSCFATAGSTTLDTTSGSYGSFTGGYPVCTGTGSAAIRNTSPGSFCWGYPGNTGSGAQYIGTTGAGAFCVGVLGGSGAHTMRASGAGSFLQGTCTSSTASSMLAQSSGSFAQGTAFTGGSVVSSGQGSFAQGTASGASAITASGNGSFAQGQATAGNAITASSPGSMAVGASAAGAITATATNAVQFGVGGNAQADSVSVGVGPRLKGTVGAPGTPRNGDLWVANNYVYIRSNGVSCKCVNAAM